MIYHLTEEKVEHTLGQQVWGVDKTVSEEL